ncbi:MAG: glucose/arabinose dehydrogenase [Verrucomicrobiales bacterium]|jgi:glucose/arabinose dehydrogenase
MKTNASLLQLSAILLASSFFTPTSSTAEEVPDGVWVREGYKLTVAVDALKSPRFLAFGPNNTLYVSTPKEGKVYACKDADGNGSYESMTTFIEGRDPKMIPQGIQWHDDDLWLAQLDAVTKHRDTDGDGKADKMVQVLGPEDVPTGEKSGHSWRALLIHNDKIYTHVGDQTNATDEPIDASERKKIWTFNLDGSDKKLFSSGVRNSEKLAVRPGTDEVWGVDHDIDTFASKLEGEKTAKFGQPITDHNPPAELNHYQEGHFYGHPWIVGKNQPNLNFLDHPKLIEYASMSTIPEWLMPAHCSANSLTFYTGDKIPDAKGDAFVAQKGGWNATKKVGYRLSRILFEDGHPYGELKMVSFLDSDKVLGRPVDCAQAPDGSIIFSDDTGHKVYRLAYVGK